MNFPIISLLTAGAIAVGSIVLPLDLKAEAHKNKPTSQYTQSQKQLIKRLKQSRTGNRRKVQIGVASYYGYESGLSNYTASGQYFNPEAMAAASNTLRMHTKVRVTNLGNGKSVVVTINDTGGFSNIKSRVNGRVYRGRIIDLTYGAARKLNFIKQGLAEVKVEVLE